MLQYSDRLKKKELIRTAMEVLDKYVKSNRVQPQVASAVFHHVQENVDRILRDFKFDPAKLEKYVVMYVTNVITEISIKLEKEAKEHAELQTRLNNASGGWTSNSFNNNGNANSNAFGNNNANSFGNGNAFGNNNANSFGNGNAFGNNNANSFGNGNAFGNNNANSFGNGNAFGNNNANSFGNGTNNAFNGNWSTGTSNTCDSAGNNYSGNNWDTNHNWIGNGEPPTIWTIHLYTDSNKPNDSNKVSIIQTPPSTAAPLDYSKMAKPQEVIKETPVQANTINNVAPLINDVKFVPIEIYEGYSIRVPRLIAYTPQHIEVLLTLVQDNMKKLVVDTTDKVEKKQTSTFKEIATNVKVLEEKKQEAIDKANIIEQEKDIIVKDNEQLRNEVDSMKDTHAIRMKELIEGAENLKAKLISSNAKNEELVKEVNILRNIKDSFNRLKAKFKSLKKDKLEADEVIEELKENECKETDTSTGDVPEINIISIIIHIPKFIATAIMNFFKRAKYEYTDVPGYEQAAPA